MDDADDGEGAQTRGARRRREPKLKYMQILQDIANRDASNIVIELDDLDVVSPHENSVALTIVSNKALL
jgi:DNA replication licensing factor MCM7